VLIAVFNALLGVAAIRLARAEAGILQRVLLAVLGTLALLAGSGMIMVHYGNSSKLSSLEERSIFGKSVSIAQEKDKSRESELSQLFDIFK